MKVLAIDDNHDNLISLAAMLRSFLPGCQVATALSGNEGIDKARAFQPDTILLDIQMPEMDGFETCRILKTDAGTRDIPVIFLTAQSTDPENRIRGLEIGGDAFLTKPVEPGELMAQVRVMMRIKNAEDLLRGEKRSLEQLVDERTAALQTSKDRYHGLFESMLNGFALHEIICDAQGKPCDYRFLDVNPAFERLTGLTADKIVGRTVLEVMPNTERRWIDAYGQVALTGESARFEEHSQPLARWYHVLAYRPAPRQFACVFEDVTERVKAQQALVASEEKYRRIVDTANEGIWVLDSGDKTTYVNHRMAAMMGHAPEAMLGKPMEAFLFQEDIAEQDRQRARRQLGESETYERRLRRKDGSECWCFVSATPLRDSHGAFAGSFGMFTDITERKQLQAQLLQAQKMQAIGQLAGGVAHDFRNQLTIIKGYGEMLLRESFSPEQARSLLAEVLRAADRATKVTGQLLAFSRKDMLQPQVVNLSQVVAGMADHLVRLVGEDIRISIVGGDRSCPVNIAANQFEQAIMNLVTNARDAMSGGGDLLIEVSPVHVDATSAARNHDARPGDYVRVTVRDAGCGMNRQTLARLFEPFFTTKRMGEGTGLGLPMVYGFVTQSGGFINVQSEPNKGSAFDLYFPLADKAIDLAQPDVVHKPTARGSEALLIVEDEEPIRRLLAMSLQEAGYTVVETGTAREAIRLAASETDGIEMLITDVVMPGMNGVELARQVRQTRPGIPVLFISGYGGRDLSRRGIDMDRVELLEKPFEHAEIIATVRRLLDKRSSHQPEQPPVAAIIDASPSTLR